MTKKQNIVACILDIVACILAAIGVFLVGLSIGKSMSMEKGLYTGIMMPYELLQEQEQMVDNGLTDQDDVVSCETMVEKLYEVGERKGL